MNISILNGHTKEFNNIFQKYNQYKFDVKQKDTRNISHIIEYRAKGRGKSDLEDDASEQYTIEFEGYTRHFKCYKSMTRPVSAKKKMKKEAIIDMVNSEMRIETEKDKKSSSKNKKKRGKAHRIKKKKNEIRFMKDDEILPMIKERNSGLFEKKSVNPSTQSVIQSNAFIITQKD